MKLLSIDTETTGLDPQRCGVLEVGAVLFEPHIRLEAGVRVDSRWQFYEALVDNQFLQGDAFALQMNQEVLAEISGAKPTHIPILKANLVATRLRDFLLANGVSPENKVTIVGKNYDAFDRRFLEKLPGWKIHIDPLVERRALDLGSLFFRPGDGRVLNLQSCLERIGIKQSVKHRAMDDAMVVATCISRYYA